MREIKWYRPSGHYKNERCGDDVHEVTAPRFLPQRFISFLMVTLGAPTDLTRHVRRLPLELLVSFILMGVKRWQGSVATLTTQHCIKSEIDKQTINTSKHTAATCTKIQKFI